MYMRADGRKVGLKQMMISCMCPFLELFQWHMKMKVILIVIVVSTIIVLRRRKKHDGPPAPAGIPLIGHLHLLTDPLLHRAFHNLSSPTRYGPIFQIFLGSVRCVVASTPETAKQFLKTHESCFSDRVSNVAIHHLTYGSKGFVFAPYGPYWKFIKKICVSKLLGGRTLDLLRPVRRSETLRFLRVLATKAKCGEAIDVGEELMTVSNSIISRMIMGRTSSGNDKEAQEIRKLVMDTMEVAGKVNLTDLLFGGRFNFWGINKRVKECRARFDHLMDGVIHEHQQERRKTKQLEGSEEQPRDLLHILLDIHEDDTTTTSNGIKLTKDNIKAFLLDLFMAATDTSAITVEWALSELINHPRVMEKAREEIDSIVGKQRIVEESDIANLPYLEGIVKETLRLHPPFAMVGRMSNESCNVCGYDIPAKTVLFVNVWSIGRNPNYWKEPLEFRPERFMSGGEKENLDVRGQHFELMPFGSGRRACPGASLGLNVVQANLGAMIQCFDWKLDGGKQSVDMQEKSSATIPRANPLICYLVPRLHPFPTLL